MEPNQVDAQKSLPAIDMETLEHASRSIFGLLNRIYSSVLLPNRLKHYFACRVLCLGYNAVSASIFLYEGAEEKLVSKGIYLHRNGHELLNRPGTNVDANTDALEKQHMVKYLGFYHFLFSKFISTGLQNVVSDEQALQLAKYFKSREYLGYSLPREARIIENGTEKVVLMNNDKDVIAFVQFCLKNSRRHATNKAGVLDKKSKYYYQLFKELVTAEKYDIGPDVSTYSGRVYHKYSHPGSIRNDGKLIIEMQDDFLETKIDYNLNDNLRKIGLKFCSKLYYAGVPLISGGRCIGIVRLLYPIEKDKDTTAESRSATLRETGLFFCRKGKEAEDIKNYLVNQDTGHGLLYAIEILGNLLDQTYAQSFLESIPRDYAFLKDLGSEYQPYNEWCTHVQKAINCHGCSLFLKETAVSGPARRGYSDSIKSFVQNLQQHPEVQFLIRDGQFHQEFTSIFPDVNAEIVNRTIVAVGMIRNQNSRTKPPVIDKTIVAVLIDFGLHYLEGEMKVIRYYYCIGNQEEVRAIDQLEEAKGSGLRNLQLTDPSNLDNSLITEQFHQVFTGNYVKETIEQKRTIHRGRYLLIVNIPSIEVAGLATFTNSPNRQFSLSDVRFAYSQVKRLGLSISQIQSASLKVAISNSLHSIKYVNIPLMELKAAIVANENVDEALNHLTMAFNRYQRRINSLVHFNDTGNFLKNLSKPSEPYDLIAFLSSKIMEEYTAETRLKEMKIDISYPVPACIETGISKECVWLCLEGLLDNALKYSPSGTAMTDQESRYYVSGFTKNTDCVPGNVKVEFEKQNKAVLIRITNHCPPVSMKMLSEFKRWNLSPNQSYGKQGLGLHLVRLFLMAINSDWIDPVTTRQTITFGVKINL